MHSFQYHSLTNQQLSLSEDHGERRRFLPWSWEDLYSLHGTIEIAVLRAFDIRQQESSTRKIL